MASGRPGNAASPPALRSDCETQVNTASFASPDQLWELERKLDSYGVRSTGSAAHQQYVDWLESQLRTIPGIELRADDFPIARWSAVGGSLEAGAALGFTLPVPISAIVPYARATPADGLVASLAYVPSGTAITAENSGGKIVLRDVVASSQPNATMAAVMWWMYDPDLSFLTNLNGKRENKQGVGREDLDAAQAAGAAGLIYLHEFPRAQVLDLYRPYEGVLWSIPAFQVGADEAALLRQLAAGGGVAQMKLAAVTEPAVTRMLVATLPGVAEDALVIESHTDGTSALWDNGPLAMLALARYFGQFERHCRPRPLTFVFTTAHLYQQLVPPYRGGSADLYAQEMDRAYEEGRASAAIVIEHLGAREYTAIPRPDGGPGRELTLTDRHELNTFFVTESVGLQDALLQSVAIHDLRESYALRGTGLPGAHLPLTDNFGGEGNSYIRHLLPTVAFIVAPWTLFTPGYSLQGIDPALLYKQSLVFGDLIHKLGALPREVLAGPPRRSVPSATGCAPAARMSAALCCARARPRNRRLIHDPARPADCGSLAVGWLRQERCP
ncbi:MAG TPA: hypothetical protein VM074_08160 [Solimonas sp.]|nr:hypothetical protein [Solimonas sp.]